MSSAHNFIWPSCTLLLFTCEIKGLPFITQLIFLQNWGRKTYEADMTFSYQWLGSPVTRGVKIDTLTLALSASVELISGSAPWALPDQCSIAVHPGCSEVLQSFQHFQTGPSHFENNWKQYLHRQTVKSGLCQIQHFASVTLLPISISVHFESINCGFSYTP